MGTTVVQKGITEAARPEVISSLLHFVEQAVINDKK